MGKHWKEVCSSIQEECRKIWFETPDYVLNTNMGIFTSGAGLGDFVMGNRYNLMCEMLAMSHGVAEPTLMSALDDPDFSLDQCKELFVIIYEKISLLVGDVNPPMVPTPWWNLGIYKELYQDVVDSFDSVETKDELRNLVWMFGSCFSARLNCHFQTGFQWENAPKRADEEFIKVAAAYIENGRKGVIR